MADEFLDLKWSYYCIVCSSNNCIKKVHLQSEDDIAVNKIFSLFLLNYYVCGNCSRKVIGLCDKLTLLNDRCKRIVKFISEDKLSATKIPSPKGPKVKSVTRVSGGRDVGGSPVCQKNSVTPSPSKIPVASKRMHTSTPVHAAHDLVVTKISPVVKKTRRNLFSPVSKAG
jgi:hypothetical protein